MKFRIGIDIGGTFTDFVVQADDGSLVTHKILSTPEDPSIALVEGLKDLAGRFGLAPEEFAGSVTAIVHGTTVTTNALLTRSGAKTGLLTTAGVRDALEMRRGIRERQYDNRFPNAEPLVPRERRLPVRGRIAWDGSEIEPLAAEDVTSALERLRNDGVRAVAICFMNSFANPDHERAAAELVRSALPEAYVAVSSELLPVIRFYDRVSTTVIDAYVGEVLGRYLERLGKRLAELGFGGVLLIMQSNGGVAEPDLVRRRPATTLLSGPAGGPVAAVAYAGGAGADCIVVDMGGTSFDASLVRGGLAETKVQSDIDRLRIALPMLAITTIGAGGGSIGWIDKGGLLRMGPRSAGASPGPACYGRGGREPTCTDANLLLGYFDPKNFAGGRLELSVEAARSAVEERIARPLGLSVEEAAAGMHRVIDANMAHGVREVTVKRGLDPRDFPMVVAGGAGGLHACAIAKELGIRRIVFPPTASVLCAAGMLMTELKHDFVRSCVARLDALEPETLRALVAEMAAEGKAMLAREGVPESGRRVEVTLDLRYRKQYHEVQVPGLAGAVERGDLAAVAEAFHAEHDRLYGYSLRDEGVGIEVINVRVRAVGAVERPRLPRAAAAAGDPGRGARPAYSPEDGGFVETPVFDGTALGRGFEVEGPALIERPDTTLFVTRAFRARVDELGSILLEAKEV